MGKIFALTSGKGGVGKSTVSVGLALSFSKMGYKTLVVDMDEGLRCLDLMLGVDNEIVFDLSDILQGKEIGDAVYEINQNLFLIPAPQNSGMMDAFNLANFANAVNNLYDIIVYDFPAGIDFSLYSSLPKSTLFLTVAFPDAISVRDAAVVSDLLAKQGLSSKLIINRFQYKLSSKKAFKSIDDIIDEASLQLVGIIPESHSFTLISCGILPKTASKPMKAFTRITKRLLGQNVLLPKIKKI